MESWTFLIQKEGDTVWLPLDAPESEILEGRYRLMGRTKHSHCPVAIQVSYLDVEGFPPCRRVKKRQASTNRKGLVPLLPFTHLKPGMWDIRCQYSLGDQAPVLADGDGVDDQGARSPSHHRYRHALQIQVLAQDLEPELEALTAAPIPLTRVHRPLGVGQSDVVQPDVAGRGQQGAMDQEEPVVSQNQLPDTNYSATVSGEATPDAVAELDDRETDLAGKRPENATKNDSENADMESILAVADQMADQIIATMKAKIQSSPMGTPSTPGSAPSGEAIASPPVEPNNSIDLSQLALVLNQTAYVVSADAPLTLVGQVVERGHHRHGPPVIPRGELIGLEVQLIQPQTGQSVAVEQASLSLLSLPALFNLPIPIPRNLDTHLLMGEVLVVSDLSQDAERPTDLSSITTDPSSCRRVLARQSFTVTIAINSLLDHLKRVTPSPEQRPKTVLSPFQDLTLTDVELQLPDPTLALTLEAKAQTRSPQPYNPLPPKLSSPSDAVVNFPAPPPRTPPSGQSLNLPSFLQTDGDRPPSPLAIAIGQVMGLSLSPSPLRTGEGDTSATASTLADQTITAAEGDRRGEESATLPDAANADTMGNPFGELSWDVLEEANGTDATVSPEHPPAVDSSGNDDHFDAAARDADSTWDGVPAKAVASAGISSNPIANDAIPTRPNPTVGNADDIAVAASRGGNDPFPTSAQPPNSPQPLRPLPQHLSIPTPIIHLPDQDLVAGHPVRLTVTLPVPNEIKALASRDKTAPIQLALPLIFVKLWVQDRQTRSILDGPRWLVDFINNSQGNLESMTQLVLPIGCMEVSVEAIAVELLTQRESHKMTLHRTVSPATLPSHLASLSLDDLN